VDIGNLEFGLFTRPQYGHYYFGDYYDSVYIGIGIFPWFEFERRHTWYDPIYVNDRWRHRKEGQRWEQHQRQEYDRRRADKTLRVPGTYREMARRASKMPESQRKNFEIAAPMTRVARGKTTDFKFEQSTPQAQKKISRHAADAQKFVKERSAWESQSGGRAAARPPKKHEGVPAAEGRQKASSVTPKGPAAGASPRETKYHQPDKMKIRTPPVAGKKGGGSSRKGTPSRPTGESVY
jgi:hypothetical protein